MSGKKLLVVGLAVLLVVGTVFAVACGGSGDAGKVKMQEALTVVEQDIASLTATFSTGQGTGAGMKAAITAVKPHWQAVIDACADVKGADAVKAQDVFTAVETAVNALPDTAGLAQMTGLLGPVQALTTFEQELRTLVGGATTTTAAN